MPVVVEHRRSTAHTEIAVSHRINEGTGTRSECRWATGFDLSDIAKILQDKTDTGNLGRKTSILQDH
jgi:hypothetical protein